MNGRIHRAYDSLNPDAAAKERMLNNILEAAAKKQDRKSGRRSIRSIRRTLCIAAVIVMLAALSVTAYANDWFGLSSTVIGKHELDFGNGYSKAVDLMSLQGWSDSPEYQACKEWQEFIADYDRDGSILAEIGNSPTEFDDKYWPYDCYTQEMADKIDKICEKYSLSLLTGFTIFEDIQDEYAMAGTGEICPENDGNYENMLYTGYAYDDGTLKFSGDAYLLDPALDWPYVISYEFIRCVKGSLNTVALNIGDIDDYTQWNYTTENGVELVLAQSYMKELIIADLGESFVVINLYNVYVGDISRGELRKSPEALEAVAEIFDFSVIP